MIKISRNFTGMMMDRKVPEKLTFPAMFRAVVEKHGNGKALAFVDGEELTYKQLENRIKALMAMLEQLGIQPGDRVAILSHNMPNWGIAYLGTTFMGAVAVPLMPDFHPDEMENILRHSGSKVLFVSTALQEQISGVDCPELKYSIRLDDFTRLDSSDALANFDPSVQSNKEYAVEEKDLAALFYTSGTTGSSKGVMLTHKNICSNVVAGLQLQHVREQDRFLSILPLSHTFENTIGFLLPLFSGASVYYLDKPPSPSILIPALQKIRPTMMLSVPLVIEKIYFNRILPTLSAKAALRTAMKIPFVRRIMHRLAGLKLKKTFGGSLVFFGIGGAKLNAVVERFLKEARFPYAIGYGLTETAPLLAGAGVGKVKHQSTGPAIAGVQLRIHDPDPVTGEGEIWAKGPNVMQGYFKEPGLTDEVLTADGWFKTGDLGVMDHTHNLFIKGRLKNMILGSDGKNIYPEEIESVINNFKHVLESLVIERKGKLLALVHLNMDELSNQLEAKAEELIDEIKNYVNARVNAISQLHAVQLQPVPFIKTPTQKIKRFLYT